MEGGGGGSGLMPHFENKVCTLKAFGPVRGRYAIICHMGHMQSK